MKTGIQLIFDERERQNRVEGYTTTHDDTHRKCELRKAAECYAMPPWNRTIRFLAHKWPWERRWWKPTPKDRVRELVKAGALYMAEMDRQGRLRHVPTVKLMRAKTIALAAKIDRLQRVTR